MTVNIPSTRGDADSKKTLQTPIPLRYFTLRETLNQTCGSQDGFLYGNAVLRKRRRCGNGEVVASKHFDPGEEAQAILHSVWLLIGASVTGHVRRL